MTKVAAMKARVANLATALVWLSRFESSGELFYVRSEGGICISRVDYQPAGLPDIALTAQAA